MLTEQFFFAHDTKFLRVLTDSTLSWKLHIEQVLHMPSAAYYADLLNSTYLRK
jgi:hypothetical protein